MSSAAERAAARRAKILARSSERMGVVTGGMPSSSLPSPSPSAEPLSREESERELERALELVAQQHTPTVAAAAAPSSKPEGKGETPASEDTDPAAAAPSAAAVPDPHEFLSAAEAKEFSAATQPLSPSSSSMDSLLASSSFERAAAASASGASSASLSAARRRHMREASHYDVSLPPAPSSFALWRRRVSFTARSISPVRALCVAAVVLVAFLAGLGFVESALGWLLLIEMLAQSTSFLIEKRATPKVSEAQQSSCAMPPKHDQVLILSRSSLLCSAAIAHCTSRFLSSRPSSSRRFYSLRH